MKEISAYLQHSGTMCLIDEVISVDELTIHARTLSHQNINNPLRFADNLPAVTGIEYAAQTLSLHLALTKNEDNKPSQGFLASVQHCVMNVENLDEINFPLEIHCKQVYFDDIGGALYEFSIAAEKENILSGKLLIMFLVEKI